MNDDETNDDDALWHAEMCDVQPLAPSQKITLKKDLKSKRKVNNTNRSVSENAPSKPITKPRASDIDARTLQKLKRGQIQIEARLDLHGMSKYQAYDALYPFLFKAHNAGMRCVLVITGKGQSGYENRGVLREALPEWLSEPRYNALTLTHSPAQQRDGGAGAFYIYLRRNK